MTAFSGVVRLRMAVAIVTGLALAGGMGVSADAAEKRIGGRAVENTVLEGSGNYKLVQVARDLTCVDQDCKAFNFYRTGDQKLLVEKVICYARVTNYGEVLEAHLSFEQPGDKTFFFDLRRDRRTTGGNNDTSIVLSQTGPFLVGKNRAIKATITSDGPDVSYAYCVMVGKRGTGPLPY